MRRKASDGKGLFHIVRSQQGLLIRWHWAETWRKQGSKLYRYLGRLKCQPGQWGCGRGGPGMFSGSKEAGVAEYQMCRAPWDTVGHCKDFVFSSEMGNLWKLLNRGVTWTGWRGAKRKQENRVGGDWNHLGEKGPGWMCEGDEKLSASSHAFEGRTEQNKEWSCQIGRWDWWERGRKIMEWFGHVRFEKCYCLFGE